MPVVEISIDNEISDAEALELINAESQSTFDLTQIAMNRVCSFLYLNIFKIFILEKE